MSHPARTKFPRAIYGKRALKERQRLRLEGKLNRKLRWSTIVQGDHEADDEESGVASFGVPVASRARF